MKTTQRQRVEGRACIVDAPSSWTAEHDASNATAGPMWPDLVLVGPHRGCGPRPRVSISVVESTDALYDAPGRVWESVQRAHPQAILTSSDVWPHPVWGEGRLVQTARVEQGATLAHDCYVFVDAERSVRMEVDCALVDLLPLEDQLADIVVHTRPKVA